MDTRLYITIDSQFYVLELASLDRRTWRIVKMNNDSYVIRPDLTGMSCSCPWATFHPGERCKHVSALISVGILPIQEG